MFEQHRSKSGIDIKLQQHVVYTACFVQVIVKILVDY